MSLLSSSTGSVQGHDGQDTLVCQIFHRASSQGALWSGGDPFGFNVPIVLSQLIVIFSVTSTIWLLIKPLKQGHISAQLIAGIILGQSFLGRIKGYTNEFFPPGGKYMLETFADLGLMYYMFILGVHIDLSLVKKLQRSAVMIGLLGYFLPYLISMMVTIAALQLWDIRPVAKRSLPFVVTLNAISSFPVITSLLADLNILSSEIGRIATLASLVSDLGSYMVSIVMGTMVLCVLNKSLLGLLPAASAFTFLLVNWFVLRPVIITLAKVPDEGQKIKESKFILITVLVMLCGLTGQVLGQPAEISAFFLGVLIPGEVAEPFINKLDIITTGLLVPAKFVLIGMKVNISSVTVLSGAMTMFIILVCYMAKFGVIFLLGLHYSFPGSSAAALGLIMSCKGVIEATLYFTLQEDGVLSDEAFSLMMISMVVMTGVARPLIGHLYNPSEKYQGKRKNCAVLLGHPNAELRMLVCLHNADSVPTLINLLDASTPHPHRTMVSVLNLVELKGKGASVLEINSERGKPAVCSRSWSKQAANAFDLFVERHQGSVDVRHYTSIAPYSSMHDDICTLALDKSANILVVPFHKQWGEATASTNIRMVNQRVLSDSPCSVGVLIDRDHLTQKHSLRRGQHMFEITVLFLGGNDDCEALAYCNRLIENPQIILTLVWIRPCEPDTYSTMETVERFRARTIENDRIVFQEEMVQDAIGTTRVIRSLEKHGCDLCIVGKHHEPQLSSVYGLTDWNEFPELGLIGGLLASSDFRFSVLVVQKEPSMETTDQLAEGEIPRPMMASSSSANSISSDYQELQSTMSN